MSQKPSRLHAQQPLRLASCIAIACGSLALGSSQASAQQAPRIVLRDDPSARIFPSFRPDLADGEQAGNNANVLQVTNCEDDGPGSLRAAVASAGENDVVDLTELDCSLITLTTGAIPVMLNSLDIEGPGSDLLRIDGDNADRLFLHYGGGHFDLRGLTLQHGVNRTAGFHVAGGGCVASAGYLTLDHSTITGCYAIGEGAYGGAVYAYSLSMIASTVERSTAYGVLDATSTAAFGGAAFVYTMDLTDSTVSGNRAEHRLDPPRTSYDIGGAVATVRGGSILRSTVDSNYSLGRAGGVASFSNLAIINSTISGNTALDEIGGGIFMRRPATLALTSSTVTSNAAPDGAGVFLSMGGGTFQSSIVYGNTTTGVGMELQSSEPATVVGANNLTGANGTALILPDDTMHTDPMLLPLAFNGGLTRTHALPRASTAIDAGNNVAASTSDQRGEGFPRVVGAAADIGAFEFSASAQSEPSSVPSLSTWTITLLGLLLAAFGSRWQSPSREDRKSA
ncbi:MAG: choice-of-anchor Q domain-containing protein [Rhodanobacteraceae bacterium]